MFSYTFAPAHLFCCPFCFCLYRHFGLQVTQAWCLWAGGTSLSDLALSTAQTDGDYCVY